MSNWRDPSWRKVKDILDGLEGDIHDARAGLFGENVIDIEEKPILGLLIDEVHTLTVLHLTSLGITSILHLPSVFNHFMVNGRILLLRRMYFYHQRHLSLFNSNRNPTNNASHARNGTLHMPSPCFTQWILENCIINRHGSR